MTSANQLSPAQARKLVLLSQGIHKEQQLGRGQSATLAAIKKLGYVQIDTISVVERAHHHTLWSRVSNYQKEHLDQLLAQGEIFEYWSHAAAYLPMRDFRYSLPRKQAIKNGEKHWYTVDDKLLKKVLSRVRAEGPLQSKDFKKTVDNTPANWSSSPTKRALQQLFMRGDLMIAKREGFQKVYDLPERVLPAKTDTRMPSEDEYLQHLVEQYLLAQGLGTPSQTGHLRKNIKPKLRDKCEQLADAGRIARVQVGDLEYFARADFAEVLSQPLSQQKIKILSPFDNLLIQRNRTQALFDFDYQIECYVTEKKRKFGYFVLPILWGQSFAGRMDAKIDRKTGVLTVHKLYVETKQKTQFLHQLHSALDEFCAFNGGSASQISEVIDLSV